MTLRLMAVSSLIVLAGCASYTWTKDGATPESTRADQMSCQQMASRPADVFQASDRAKMGPGVEAQMANSNASGSCMESLGYTLTPTGK